MGLKKRIIKLCQSSVILERRVRKKILRYVRDDVCGFAAKDLAVVIMLSKNDPKNPP